MKMVATYSRGKKLNVRKEPSPTAPVVRKMERGDSADCLGVEFGWAKLPDGYAKADYLQIALVEPEVTEARADADEPEQPEPTESEQPEAEQPEQSEPEQPEDDEAAELRKMSNPQLYELAAKSGVKVRKGANKDALIAAILADAE